MRSLLFWIGVRLERKKNVLRKTGTLQPFISVIVPARNEAANIEQCIRSLTANSFPSDKYEIIAVNDRSSDKTGDILIALQDEFPQLRICTTNGTNLSGNLRGKTRALAEGIAIAHGDVFMMTDADCTVGKEWIATAAQVFSNEKIGLLASFTVIKPQSVFETMQSIEWIYNHTLASAGVGLNQPLGCFGNNLCISRQAYFDIGGYENIPFSVTEDLALMQAAAKTPHEIRYLCLNDLKVVTKPAEDWETLIRQHHRWAKGGQALGWRATIFVISSLALWLGVLATAFSGNYLYSCLILIFRIVLDYCVVASSFAELKMKYILRWFPLAILFLMCLEFIAPFLLLNNSIKWKGQIFVSK